MLRCCVFNSLSVLGFSGSWFLFVVRPESLLPTCQDGSHDNVREVDITTVVLTPGACGRGSLAAVGDTGSGSSGGSRGSGRAVFQTSGFAQ